jgi:hypothetical protein
VIVEPFNFTCVWRSFKQLPAAQIKEIQDFENWEMDVLRNELALKKVACYLLKSDIRKRD